jgi:peptidoglycan/LPS O-acetylase OafA/YrhL
MPLSVNRGYLPEIDQLRAFAALLVLFYHGFQAFGAQLTLGTSFDASQHWLYASNPITALIVEGHAGVGLFFVLSGFILSLGAIGNTVSFKPFIVARALRIYPLLVVCVLVAGSFRQRDLMSFLATLLPFNTSGGMDGPFVGLLWTVAIAFQCYLIFPFLVAFSNQRGSRFLLQVIAVAFMFRALAVFADTASARDLSYGSVLGRIDEFCIGMIAARLVVGMKKKPSAWWFVPSAIATGLILWRFNRLGGWPVTASWKIAWPTIEGAMWACVIVTYIAFGRLLPYPISWGASKVGEISYSVYLIHSVVIVGIIRHGLYLRPTGNGYYDALVTTLLVALPVVLAVSLLTYHTIELPFLKMRPKYISSRADELAAPVDKVTTPANSLRAVSQRS